MPFDTVSAQVRVGPEFGILRFHGGSRPATSSDSLTLQPYGPFAHGVHGLIGGSRWRVGLALTWSRTGALFTFKGSDLRLVDGALLKMLSAQPTVGRRVSGLGTAADVWLEAGPSFDVWSIPGEQTRIRVGALVRMALRQRLTSHVETVARLHGAVSGSPFQQSDGITGLRLTTVWRYGLSFGLDYRF